MKKKKTLNQARTKEISDITGFDFSSSGIKIVRLRKMGAGVTLVGADLLPSVELGKEMRKHIELPKTLIAKHAAAAYTFPDALVRVLTMPVDEQKSDIDHIEKLKELLNVEDTQRASFRVISQGKSKKDSVVLGVAVPGEDVTHLLACFSDGIPALRSLEIAGLASISAFQAACGEKHADDCVCLLESGKRVTYLSFLDKRELLLCFKIDVGADTLTRRVENDLGVDTDMVRTILAGGGVDITSSVDAVFDSTIRQLSISRDFVERKTGKPLSNLYITGGMGMSGHLQEPIQNSLGIDCDVWNPLDAIELTADSWPEKLQGQERRFAGALGAALSAMNDKRIR